jgi:hypothetical protein
MASLVARARSAICRTSVSKSPSTGPRMYIGSGVAAGTTRRSRCLIMT